MRGVPPEHSKFKKGQSGNPKGRPRKLPHLDKLLASVLGEEKNGITAAEVILKALKAKAAKGDIRAAEVLLDRAYGKAKQSIDIASLGKALSLPVLNVDPLASDNSTSENNSPKEED